MDDDGLWKRLERVCRNQGSRTALVFGETRYTFSALQDRAEKLAGWLTARHRLRRGDRLVWMGLNHIEIIPLFFACARIGAIFTPFNSRLAPPEYRFLIETADPSLIVHDDHFAGQVRALAPDCATVAVGALGEMESSGEDGSGHDTALLVFTSGTTGRPKGVELSQAAVLANVEHCHAVYGFEPDDRVLITLPLFHVGGLCILLLPALLSGSCIHLHERFDPDATIASIEQDAITITILVPAQMAAIFMLNRWETSDISSLRVLVVGSSIIPLAQIQAFHRRGVPVSQVYGATETGPAAICLELDDCIAHEGAAGTPAKLCTIRIVDEKDEDVPDGQAGEILVAGPNVMTRYWRDEVATEAAFLHEYYRTGDIGIRDHDGFFTIIDRLRDMIISGGENIYPAEIEAVSLTHPAISAIAVVGRPDRDWGESPVAFVELKPGKTLTLESYSAFLADRLARYKHPKTLVIEPELPRNSMGKIEKPILRQRALNLD